MLQERRQAFEVVARGHQHHGCAGSGLTNAAQEFFAHVPNPCEHVFNLGSAFGNRSVAALLAGTQWLVLLRLARDTILKIQCFEHGASLGTGIAFVGVDLLACVAQVQHFVKVVSIVLAGCACRNTADKAMFVIDAGAELVAKVTLAMLFGMRGIQVFLPALGIAPLWRITSRKFAAI